MLHRSIILRVLWYAKHFFYVSNASLVTKFSNKNSLFIISQLSCQCCAQYAQPHVTQISPHSSFFFLNQGGIISSAADDLLSLRLCLYVCLYLNV